jgi:hypothetical protein
MEHPRWNTKASVLMSILLLARQRALKCEISDIAWRRSFNSA